jgi:lipid-A-disaccharide synthase
VYYISPQIWAWKKGRIHTIAKLVDKMLVILPFEEALYRAVGVDCAYVGHPLLDQIARFRSCGLFKGDCLIGLLPGSREQEVARLMGTMVGVARGIKARHPGARFVVPCVDARREAQIRGLAEGCPIETVVGQTYEVLSAARFCLVASGTATLEAAIFGVPMAIVYRTAPLNYWIARHVVKIEHIGLANILAGREIVPEFIQGRATAGEILPHALELIDETPRRKRMVAELRALKAGLGEPGASGRAAREVLAVVRGARHG